MTHTNMQNKINPPLNLPLNAKTTKVQVIANLNLSVLEFSKSKLNFC